MSKHENRSSFGEHSPSELDDTGEGSAREADIEVNETQALGIDSEEKAAEPVPPSNACRDEDWVDGQCRVPPPPQGPEPRRRFQLEGASSEEIEEAEARMLADLTCEAYDHSKDCFEIARGIEDGAGARTRKLALGCRLATLTMQLIAASDKHRKAMKGV